jgi:hypothetical protein
MSAHGKRSVLGPVLVLAMLCFILGMALGIAIGYQIWGIKQGV